MNLEKNFRSDVTSGGEYSRSSRSSNDGSGMDHGGAYHAGPGYGPLYWAMLGNQLEEANNRRERWERERRIRAKEEAEAQPKAGSVSTDPNAPSNVIYVPKDVLTKAEAKAEAKEREQEEEQDKPINSHTSVGIKILQFIALIAAGILILIVAYFFAPSVQPAYRQKLPAAECTLVDTWAEDYVGWISKPGYVKIGLEDFYRTTGIQPFLLICNKLDGNSGEMSDDEAEAALAKLYDGMFRDQGHMILAIKENDDGLQVWVYAGEDAKTIIDSRAEEIILKTFREYYSDGGLSNDSFLAKVFQESAKRLMRVDG